MWPALLILTCVLIATSWAGEPTAKSLKKCPNGHKTLKDVPIAYGLPPLEGPDAKEWAKAETNLDFVSGGCVITPDSPKHTVVCTTCRFTHNIFSTDSPKDGSWTLSSPDKAAFIKPLSPLVASFPVPASGKLKGQLGYIQSLNDRFKVSYDAVSYETAESLEQTKNTITLWLKANEGSLKYPTRTSSTPENLSINGEGLHITVNYIPHRRATSVFASFFAPTKR